MEDLLRGLLDLPQRPAVLVVRTLGLEADVSSILSRLERLARRLEADRLLLVSR